MIKKVFGLSILMAASFVYSDASLPKAKVTNIATDWGKNATFFSLSGGNRVENCSSSDKRVVVSKDNPMHDQIVSMALTAFTIDMNVVFRISGCSPQNVMNGIALELRND